MEVNELGTNQNANQEPAVLEAAPIQNLKPKKARKLWYFILPAVMLLLIGAITTIVLRTQNSNKSSLQKSQEASKSQAVDLKGISSGNASFSVSDTNKIVFNGQVQAAQGLVLQPTNEPTTATKGQIYYDNSTNQLRYYNGTEFITLGAEGDNTAGDVSAADLAALEAEIAALQGDITAASSSGVTSLQGLTGAITVSSSGGLNVGNSGNDITLGLPSLVNSLQGLTGGVIISSGNGIVVGTSGNNLTLDLPSLVNSLQGLTGNVTFSGTNGLTVSNSGNDLSFDLPQGLTVADSPTFAGLTINGTVSTNTIQSLNSSSSISFDNLGNLSINANGRNYILPTSGGASQTICTTGISCAAGGGQAVILQPGSAQTNNSNTDASIFINNTGTANLFQLQSGGTDVLVVGSNGVTTFGALGATNTAAYLCRNASNQLAACNTTGNGAAFLQGGNTFGAAAVLGTNDSNDLNIRTNSITRLTVTSAGAVSVASGGTLTVTDGATTLSRGSGDALTVTSGGTGVGLTVSNGSGTGAIALLKDNLTPVLTVADGGAVLLQNSANSAAALQIQNAAGTAILYVDTLSNAVSPGMSPGYSFVDSAATGPIVDPSGHDANQNAKVDITGDGLAVMAVWDNTQNNILITKCNDSACASRSYNHVGVALPTFGGRQFDMTTGSDGKPVIVYKSTYYDGLILVHCTNYSCSTTDPYVNLTNASVDGYPTVQIGQDGFPIAGYLNNGDLMAIHCNNTSCSSKGSPVIVWATNGDLPEMTIGYCSDGSYGCPVLATFSNGNHSNIEVYVCGTKTCSVGSSSQTVINDGGYSDGDELSITMIPDGAGNVRPFIARNTGTGTNETIVTISCVTYNCSGYSGYSVYPISASLGVAHASGVSVKSTSEGKPLIAWSNSSSNKLMLTLCNTFNCSSQATPRGVAGFGGNQVGRWPSISSSKYGSKPYVSFQESSSTPGGFNILRCVDSTCQSTGTTLASSGVSLGGGTNGTYYSNVQTASINDNLLIDGNRPAFQVTSAGDIYANYLQAAANGTVSIQSNLSTAFNVVNNSTGGSAMKVNSTTGALTLGTSANGTGPLSGSLVINNASSNFAPTIAAGVFSGNRTYTLPDVNTNATFCLSTGNCGGAGATLQSSYNNQTDGNTAEIKLDSTRKGIDIQDADSTIGSNLLNVWASGVDISSGNPLLSVGSTGQLAVRNSVDSASALTVKNVAGTAILGVDTSAGTVNLGTTGTATGKLIFSNSSSGSVTLQGGSSGSVTYTLPTTDGSSGQCIKTNASGVLSFGDCLAGSGAAGGVTFLNGISGSTTLQGTTNQISVSNNVPGQTITLSTPQDIHTGASPTFSGVTLSGGNFTQTGAGTFSTASTIQGTLGATLTGATTSINASSNFSTNINTGSSTGAVTIGNSLAGAIGLTSSGAITVQSGTSSSIGLTSGTGGITASSTTVSGTGLAVTASSLTSGSAMTVTGSNTTGTGLAVTANSVSTGSALTVSSTNSSSSAISGNLVAVTNNQTFTTQNTTAAAQTLSISRTLTNNVSPTITQDAACSDPSVFYSGVYYTTNGTRKNSSTYSCNITVGSNTQKMLIVAISTRTAATISSLTYNGVSILGNTITSYTPATGNNNIYLYYALNSTILSGSGTVSVTFSGSEVATLTAVSFNNVSQVAPSSSPTPTNTYVNGSSVTGTITPTAATDKIISISSAGDGQGYQWQVSSVTTTTPNSSVTLVRNVNNYDVNFVASNDIALSMQSVTSAASTNVTYNWPTSTGTNALSMFVLHQSSAANYFNTGNLASLSSNCVNTQGLCSDTSSILKLTQSYVSATGTMLLFSNAGTGNFIDMQNASAASKFAVSSAGAVTLAGATGGDITTATASTATAITIQPGISSAASGTGAALTLQAGNQSGTTTSTGGTLTLQGGNATGASGTRTGGAVNILGGTGSTVNGAVSINAGQNSATNINTGTNNTGTVTIGGTNSSATQTISIGSGASSTGVSTVTVGSTSSTSALTLQAGTGTATGDIKIQTAASGIINIGANSVASKTINVGSIGSDATSSTLHLADSSGSSQAVTIGSTVAGSSLTLQAGSTGNLNLNSGAGNINIGSSSTGNVNIGNTATQNLSQSISIGTQAQSGSTTTVNIGSSLGASALNLTAGSGNVNITSPNINLNQGTDHIIGVNARSTNAAGNILTIKAGNAGTGATAMQGGNLVLQAGNAAGTTGNAAGGNVIVKVGAAVGTGGIGKFDILDDVDEPFFRVQMTGGAGGGSAVTCGAYLTNTCTYTAGYINKGNNSNNLNLVSQNTTNGIFTGDIAILTGNVSGGSGASGNITIGTGSTSGTVGSVIIKNATNAANSFMIQNSSGTALLTADTTGMTLTVKTLVVEGTLTVNGHVISGNASGTTTIAAGAAACTSPTISVNGNDTAGTITVTTGTGCGATGTLGTVTFAGAYGSAPRVIMSPAESNAATLQYYNATTNTTTFTLDTNTAPTDATTYKYNYWVAQ